MSPEKFNELERLGYRFFSWKGTPEVREVIFVEFKTFLKQYCQEEYDILVNDSSYREILVGEFCFFASFTDISIKDRKYFIDIIRDGEKNA